ncbi:MAG: hypothetical protein IT193_18755 [Propionibacteriaceae bacterium]|nr:hypothetical protein [Propionibacteriaceae bacterium]
MKQWWRTALVALLVVLTGIVAPVSVVAAWANTQVGDTEAFVAAYAPLSRDPAVQQALAGKLSATVQERLDLPGITDELLGRVTGPISSRLLPSLTGPLNDLVAEFIDKQANAFVASEAFSRVWEVALRSTHTQFAALLRADDSTALSLNDGLLQLQLGPFVEALKERLVANGFPLAARIPPVTTAVDLVQLDPLTVSRARSAYRLLSVVAEWLPWLLLLLPALALSIALDRRRTVIACGAAVAVGIAIAWLAFRAGIAEGVAAAAASGLPEAATTAFTDGALGPMRGPALAAGSLGLVVAFLAWLTGRTPAES